MATAEQALERIAALVAEASAGRLPPDEAVAAIGQVLAQARPRPGQQDDNPYALPVYPPAVGDGS